ncbi:MAG: radical SAM/SPASM domain-containing protein [Chloroflexota bacterium]
MFNRIRDTFNRFFQPVQPLKSGVYTYKTSPEAEFPYRLHLRIDQDGNGILIINASTVLHLNQTGAEYAYHLIQQHNEEEVASEISQRYRVSKQQALEDFRTFRDRILTLINIPDLDPVTYLDFERVNVHQQQLTAPLRLDCALTYATPEPKSFGTTPIERVKRELLTEEWQTILQKAWEAGIPHVIFTGGEPTMRPDLVDLVSYAEGLGMVTGVLSNGYRFSEHKFLEDILQAGLDHLMIVLQENEDYCWEAIRDTIASNLFVTVHLTITSHNQERVAELLQKIADLNVKSLSLSIEAPSLKPMLEVTQNLAVEHGLTLVWDIPVPYSELNPIALELQSSEENEEYYNGAGNAWLYVEPDGDVLPAQGKNYLLGNFLLDDWSSIWQKAQQYRSMK